MAKRHIISTEEFNTAFNKIRKSRDRCIFLLLGIEGLKVSELVDLTKFDILPSCKLKIGMRKISISVNTYEVLIDWMEHRLDSSNYIFPGTKDMLSNRQIERIVHKYCGDITPASLRNYAIMNSEANLESCRKLNIANLQTLVQAQQRIKKYWKEEIGE